MNIKNLPTYSLATFTSFSWGLWGSAAPMAWAANAAPAGEAQSYYLTIGLVLALAVMAISLFFMVFYRIKLEKTRQELQKARDELTQNSQALEEASKTDPLTGINNRKRIDEFLDEQLDRARRYQRPFSVIMVDIDGFKQINDSLGHHNGDQILLSFAVVLEHRSRTSDLVGRWAGEEFLIVCPETSVKGALMKVNNLRTILAECVFGVDRRITASYGVTQYMPDDSIRTLLNRAEEALSKAKTFGIDQVAALPEDAPEPPASPVD